MPPRKLTTASYLVLGMIDMLEPVTPYTLKTFASRTVVHFWSLPHTQIYAQCDKLIEAGFVSEKREDSGRRRRKLSLTAKGRKAFKEWNSSGVDVGADMRDLATLKLFFGTDPKKLAGDQLKIHQSTLDYYLSLRQGVEMDEGQALALEVGIAHERAMVKFWKGQAK